MEIFNRAKWIWPAENAENANVYCQFIQDFEIKNQSETEIYISACSDYALYVNGKYVSCRQYHDYPNNRAYDTVCLNDYVSQGRNRICVLAYCLGRTTFTYIKDRAGIIYAIKCGNELAFSGKDAYFRISPDYVQGEMARISPQLGWTFEYNAEKSDSWTDKDYIMGKDWTKVRDCDIYDRNCSFFLRPVSKLERLVRTEPKIIAAGSFIRNTQEKSAAEQVYRDYLGENLIIEKVSLPHKGFSVEKADGTDGVYYVIDMEKEVAGNVCLDFCAEKGTVLNVGYGEHLDDLRVRSFIDDRCFGFRYFAKEGHNSFIHRFHRLAGRYLQIHVTGKAVFKNAEIIPTDYNAPVKSTYKSVNWLENKINEVSVRTLRLCMHEHFEDTPWREQALYGMDSRNQALCNYYAFADYNFVKSCLKTFSGSFKEDGFFEITSPTDHEFMIPSFTFAWIMMVKDYLMYSGDYDFVKEMCPQIKYTLDKVCETIDKTGMIPTPYGNRFWNYIEWSEGLDGSRSVEKSAGDYSLPYNAFFAMALESFVTVCENLNIDCGKYKTSLGDLRDSAHSMFWSEEKEYYKSFVGGAYPEHYSQLSGALAILAGFVPEEKKDTVRNKITSDTSLTECTLSMTIYKYEALLGDRKYADFVFEEIEELWGYMICRGATSFWETIKGGWDFHRAGSLSHAWSAVPLYIYYAYLLGVKPTKPGFAEYEINPVKKNYVNAKIYTPKGYIEINNI